MILLDTAEIPLIKESLDLGIVSGVTTNPTLIFRAGVKDYVGHLQQIADLPGLRHISVEVISRDPEEMVEEAIFLYEKLKRPTLEVAIKIPCDKKGLMAAKKLHPTVPVNMTLVFSAFQAKAAYAVGASYISVFMGRIDDHSHEGISLAVLDDVCRVVDKERIIAASIRNESHIMAALILGVGSITVPPKLLSIFYNHKLTEAGIISFMKDWELTGMDSKYFQEG